MYYKKFKAGETIIEFHNNWLGEETVIVNGQIVSKKSSIWGTHHPFTLVEDGHAVRYVLTTKVNGNLQVLIDIKKDGQFVYENELIPYGTKPREPKNLEKKLGIEKLLKYDIEEAVEHLLKASDIAPKDPEIYFYLACGYSIQEKAKDGFECLKKAVANKLQNTEMIVNNDMLAFLRLQDAFEEFLGSNFTHYDPNKLKE